MHSSKRMKPIYGFILFLFFWLGRSRYLHDIMRIKLNRDSLPNCWKVIVFKQGRGLNHRVVFYAILAH